MEKITEKLTPPTFINDITERILQLEETAKEINANLEKLKKLNLHGRVKFVQKRNKIYCVYFEKTGLKTGRYLNKKETELGKQVSDYNYLKKADKAVKTQLRTLKRTKRVLQNNKIPVLSKIHSQITMPFSYSDSVFAQLWNLTKQKGPERQTDFVTKNGETVCSKSEILIANSLLEKGIPYHYEQPLKLNSATLHPDFTCLNKRTHKEFIWEHLGMMDNADYSENAISRLKLYRKNNIFLGKQLLITYETSKNPLGTADINAVIDNYLL